MFIWTSYKRTSKIANLKYVLVFKDDLTSYSWLMQFENRDSNVAVKALSKWIAALGNMDWLLSGRGAHITSKMMRTLSDAGHIPHHMTRTYILWTSGTVEMLFFKVLWAGRALPNKRRISSTSCQAVLHFVQTVLN